MGVRRWSVAGSANGRGRGRRWLGGLVAAALAVSAVVVPPASAALAGPPAAGPVAAGPVAAGPVAAGPAAAGPAAAGPAAGPVAAAPVGSGGVGAAPAVLQRNGLTSVFSVNPTNGHLELREKSQEPGGSWVTQDLSARYGIPAAAGRPAVVTHDGVVRVYTVTADEGHLQETHVRPGSTGWVTYDMTAANHVPVVTGSPTALFHHGVVSVYTVTKVWGSLHEAYHLPGHPWVGQDLSAQTGTPRAAPSPTALFHDNIVSVFTISADQGRLRESYLAPGHGWVGQDLSAQTGTPPAAGSPAAVRQPTGVMSVFTVNAAGGNLHEAFLMPGHAWAGQNLSVQTGTPVAVGTPAVVINDAVMSVVTTNADNGQLHETYFAVAKWSMQGLPPNGSPPSASGNPAATGLPGYTGVFAVDAAGTMRETYRSGADAAWKTRSTAGEPADPPVSGPPGQVALDWNLGNTGASQVSDLNEQVTGVISNVGLGKCLDVLDGSTANGAAAVSSACGGAASQNWTYQRVTSLWDDGTIRPAGSPNKCLSVSSNNGGSVESISIGGTTQMLLTASGQVWAKTGVGLGGWTRETADYTHAIAAGSDGTQVRIGGGRVYARTTIGADGWVNEGGNEPRAVAANGGIQMYLSSDGTVYARTGIGDSSGWVVESAAGQKAIAVGSDGTQMMIGADGSVFARSSVGAASGWVKELAPGAKAIATNGGVQMLVGSDGHVYARTGIGTTWTKESTITTTDPAFDTAIAAGSDGTQLMVGSDGYLYAKKGVSAGGWTKELANAQGPGFGTSIAAGADGLHAALNSSGYVAARTGIGTTFTTETDLTTEKDNGRPVQLDDCQDWHSQHWVFQFGKTGSPQLYNQAARRCLDTPSSSTANGVALSIRDCNGSAAQRFSGPTTPPPPTGPITNAAMNKCAAPAATTATPATGTAVVLSTCGSGYNGGPALRWTSNTDGTLTAAGLCLGVNGGEIYTGNRVLTVLATCAGTLDQQWVVGWDTSNRPRLLNPNSGRCLNVPNPSSTAGTQLQLYNCNNADAQVWDVPHASRTFTGPATAVPSVIPPGTSGWARVNAMNTAERVRINRVRLAHVLHAGGSNVRKAAAETLAGADTALNARWHDWVDANWLGTDGGPLDQDVAAAADADQARSQREDGRKPFLHGYRMLGYERLPDYDTDVVDFMSKHSTFRLASDAMFTVPTAKAEKAAQDKVKEIAARHAAATPSDAWVWDFEANKAIAGSADDVRRFIQYDGWPTVAPEPGTPEFRVEVEALKTRWAQGDPTNPLDPKDVLLDVEETAWAEWQAEVNAQAQPRADILAAEMQALEALRASAETMHDGLGYAWTARGILWAQDQKVSGPHAPADLKLIKAKVAALAEAAKNSAAVAKDAADKAVAVRTAAYATATAKGLPAGRGLTYAQQSVQVAQAAAAATQATVNAMQTVVAAVNATLANSATLLANASAQAHAARALYLRQSAQDSAARAVQLATQAQQQATAAATAAAKVAADKTKIATVETKAKTALAKADAAAADAAKQERIAADAKATAERERKKAADANASAQQQAAIAEAKKNEAQTAAGRANDDEATALRAESDAAAAATRAESARRHMDKLMAEAAVAEAKAAAAAGTGAADAAQAEARRARNAANDAAAAADTANKAANAARAAAAKARTAATKARAAADRAYADVRKAQAAAAETRAASVKGHSLAADAIDNARTSADQAASSRQSAADAKAEATSAQEAAQQASKEVAAALADSAVAAGQAMATGQAAREAAAAAATVAAPADEAISLADPWATSDSAAGLASLSSQAAKTIAEAQANVAAAQAVQAAHLAAAAQDAVNRAAGDAKLAAQAAADAAASASKAAASAAAGTTSANQAAADAKATQQASARIDQMNAKAQLAVEKTRNSAEAADGSADAAEAAADDSERDAAAARDAANDAAADASLADDYADDAEASAAAAREAADNAEASADAAQSSLAAINQVLASNPQSPGALAGPGSTSGAIPTELDNVYVVTVQTGDSFSATSGCVGTGGCDVTGTYHAHGYHVYLLVSCVTPSSNPEVCINTGSGPQVALDELMTEPFNVKTPAKIHVTQQQLLESSIKGLPGILFGEFIGCYKKLTPSNDGGSWIDCGFVAAELALPFAVKGISLAAKELRVAMVAYNVAGIDAALVALKASSINVRTLAKLEAAALAARSQAILKELNSCLRTGHSFAAGTGVLMANGSVKAIEDVRVDDWVRNATPGGGIEIHRVTERYVTTTDTKFTELTVTGTGGRRSIITGTQNHPFYSLTHHQFVAASNLAVDDQLQTTGSEVATVAAKRDYTGAMTTYDLSVDGVPTYFVDNDGVPVLVHNVGCDPVQLLRTVKGLRAGEWTPTTDRLTIETALGGNLPKNYPIIDSWHDELKIATDIKSIDWRAMSYAKDPKAYGSYARGLVDKLATTRLVEDNWYKASNPKIRPDMVKNWVLRIAYPEGIPAKHMEQLSTAVSRGREKGIIVFLHPIRG